LYLPEAKNHSPLPGGQKETEGKVETMMNFKNKSGKGGKAGDGKAIPQTSGTYDQGVSGSPISTERHEVKRKILVVANHYTLTNAVVDYAANLAQRLGYDIIAMNVNPTLAQSGKIFSPYNQHLRGKFSDRAQAAWSPVEAELASQGIHGEQVVKFEDLAGAIKNLNHAVKRIDFVITDAGIKDEEITGEIPLPVFSISGYQGEQIMANEQHEKASRGKLISKTIACGLGAAVVFAAVFTNTGTVMKYFTKGGIYAALPIVTVLIFSFVHGAFASNLWSLLGIEAAKKAQPRVAAKRPAARKRPRPQIQLNA
jgi:K+-sensing histidine kinase KdpD